MKIAPVAEVKARFSDYLKKSASSPVIVTKNGRPIAAIVGAPEDEEDLERFILANTPRFVKILQDSETTIRSTGGIEHREFWTEARQAEEETGQAENSVPNEVRSLALVISESNG